MQIKFLTGNIDNTPQTKEAGNIYFTYRSSGSLTFSLEDGQLYATFNE